VPPVRIPAPEPLIAPSFRDAEASFDSGRYKEAILAYDRYIREDPTTLYRAVSMFKLGMSHALLCSAPECRASSITHFKRLIALFPKSPYSAEAQFILSLHNEIERVKADAKTREEKISKLTDELERLKKIDLKRQPARIKK
jgi:tetratricopeptide (TPR) repeat protein